MSIVLLAVCYFGYFVSRGVFSFFKFLYQFFRNSAMRSLNFKYDHGEYRERVWKDKEFFEKLDLDSLYKDKDLTGFSSASSE